MTTSRALLGFLLVLALSSCGTENGESDNDGKSSNEPASGFTVTREDGSTFELATFAASCPEFPEDDPDAGFIHGFASLAGTKLDPSGEPPKGPVAMITVLDGLADGTRLELPVVEEYGSEETGVSFFIADGSNEASSSEETASGSIEILHAACEPTPVLELRIDGTLGSEFGDGESLTVEGYGQLD